MFNQVGWSELVVILLLALFVFGPERLPGLAADAGRALRSVRRYVRGVGDDLRTELGPELGDVDLASLHPRTFVRKHLLDDDDDENEVVDRLAGRPRVAVPLAAGELPPWDPDTT